MLKGSDDAVNEKGFRKRLTINNFNYSNIVSKSVNLKHKQSLSSSISSCLSFCIYLHVYKCWLQCLLSADLHKILMKYESAHVH